MNRLFIAFIQLSIFWHCRFVEALQGAVSDARMKVPSVENTELEGSPFKVWSRSVSSLTCLLPGTSSLLMSILSVFVLLLPLIFCFVFVFNFCVLVSFCFLLWMISCSPDGGKKLSFLCSTPWQNGPVCFSYKQTSTLTLNLTTGAPSFTLICRAVHFVSSSQSAAEISVTVTSQFPCLFCLHTSCSKWYLNSIERELTEKGFFFFFFVSNTPRPWSNFKVIKSSTNR